MFVMLFSYVSYSQFLTGFGIKGGVTLAEQDFDYSNNDLYFDPKPIIGFNASVFAEVINDKHFSLLADLGYEQRGNSFEIIRSDEFGNEIGRYDQFNRTHYISIGALARIRHQGKSITPYFLLGPRLDLYLGYNISYSDNYDYPENLVGGGGENKLYEDTKNINYSVNFGAGLQFEKLLPFPTMIELNYAPLINSSYNNSLVIVKDQYVNLKLGISFIKKKPKSVKK